MINEEFELKNNTIKAKKGITFYNLIFDKDKDKVKEVAICKLNGKYYELTEVIDDEGEVELIGFDTDLGMKIYNRTLQFIFIKVALELFPEAQITIDHAISKAIYGEVHKEIPLKEDDINKIKIRMQEIINKDVPINSIRTSKEDAIDIFSRYKMDDKVKLLKYCNIKDVHLYEIEGRYDYFYGPMGYSTGIIKIFDVFNYESGFILQRPLCNNLNELPKFKEQKSLTKIFIETQRWLNILGVEDVGTLNEKVINNELRNVIMVSEGLHEKKIANIADEICNKKNVKIVLIAGPSSSGKTTFANRLSIQLRVNGLIPVPLSLDNYFVNRMETPKDENGDYDYESINALDLKLLNENLEKLMNGENVELPIYNFKTGEREWNDYKIKLPKNAVLILEGIHGLNPNLISKELNSNVFKIYISALTQLNIDNHNRISTTDVRKVRRIVRDSLSRGYGSEETLKMWGSIKKGEKNNIFVYQEEADVAFNSTLVYELGVLKPYALKELNKITSESSIYSEAIRLKAFLSFFKEIDIEEVPKNSLLREFIGGSAFYEY
ncbi:threonyl-tRNA synthetase/uridine kinase [Clostridium gelidum]|uniref:Threonyl-tRNA synthetase/uridine kinase n=1 Tax=Clostridium gelidum TaxID=704125 RepID=A0ABN6IS03_9CLOT|nr:nucleoside kinase [Clostridium gelidum]BCZ44970.1 threonyl-tRNA synthetase/uridine kinase [Clostridium gelidum]